jgi:hypothetical protein
MAMSAATPSVIEETNNSNRCRLARLSLQAILQIQDEDECNIKVSKETGITKANFEAGTVFPAIKGDGVKRQEVVRQAFSSPSRQPAEGCATVSLRLFSPFS